MLSRWPLPSRFALAALLAIPATPVLASTSAAWEEFRRDVETACREAVAATMVEPQVVVDPFGLQSYGLAFLSGVSSEDGTPQSLVCVYDKVARTVEIGGTMALERAVPTLRPDLAETGSTTSSPGAGEEWTAPVEVNATTPAAPADANAPAAPAQEGSAAAPAPSGETGLPPGVSERLLSPSALAVPSEMAALQAPGQASPSTPGGADEPLFAGLCDADCAVTLDALSEPDRAELLALTAQIDRTVAANEGASLNAGPQTAREAAAAAAAVAKGEEGEIATPGEALVGAASCTLYYFGYQNEASRTVGTHQCRVSEGEDGNLVVEKTSGERLRAEIQPLVGDVSAFVGRTFQSGQGEQEYDAENPDNAGSSEFGNTVGFAAEADGQLMLISSQRRRFRESDEFFWVLAMEAP